MALRWKTCTLLLFLSISAHAAPPAPTVPDERQLLERVEEIPRLLSQRKISDAEVPDPHWREDACVACHEGKPSGGKPALRAKGEVNALCNNCHSTVSVHGYIHAVGMVPSPEKQARMPEPFRQAVTRGGGVVTCIVCHDLPMQCTKARFPEGRLNPRFFRGGPYQDRTDLCFNCHDPGHYERLNPHDQINDQGELDTQRCTVCHQIMPNRRSAKSIDDVSFNVVDDLAKLCTGCHPWRAHPGGGWATFAPKSNKEGPNHLVVPPPAVRERMLDSEKKRGIVLPLDPKTGRIFCATCHNPHERGVQRHARADKGADGYKRLRSVGSGEVICVNCHNK